MSLKSSEIDNCSWNISAILKSPFCSSSCCRRILSIDRQTQWRICGNWFWRFSFILQKWTAPSSSRCTCWEWRRRWITFFEISYAERECFRNSCSVFIGVSWLVSLFTSLSELSHPVHEHMTWFSVFEPLAWCGNAQQGWDWLIDSWPVSPLSALHVNSSKAVCTQKGSTDKEIIPMVA